jgi:hypothetical protein
LELGLSEGDAAILHRVLVRQNPWTMFDPEGLAMFGLFNSYGDYFHEVGEVFKGYGDVTVGALAATARAIVELPKNTVGVVSSLAELSQMDHAVEGVKNAGSKGYQDVKQAASDYGDRLANGDNRAWGQVIGTALTLGGAKGANFAKAAEVVEASEATTTAARVVAKTEQAVAETSSSGAESANAASALKSKLSALEDAQSTAAKTRNLPDGRMRYYDAETPATKPGPTRGASYVTEYNPKTGGVRSWMEAYDQAGKVNRVHPKMINGQTVKSQHYPPTAKELGR